MHSSFFYNTCLFQLLTLLCSTLFGNDFVNAIQFGAMSVSMNVLDLNSNLTNNLHFAVPKAIKELSWSHLFDFELEQNCYILLSQKDFITHWHVDYKNTSVFYHFFTVEKRFSSILEQFETKKFSRIGALRQEIFVFSYRVTSTSKVRCLK